MFVENVGKTSSAGYVKKADSLQRYYRMTPLNMNEAGSKKDTLVPIDVTPTFEQIDGSPAFFRNPMR